MGEPDIKLVMIETFRSYDPFGDGVISRDKLARILGQLGFGYLQDGDIDTVLNATAVEGQPLVDQIQYEELVDWITSPSTRSPDALSRCSTSADSMEKPQARERHDAEARSALEASVLSLQRRLDDATPSSCPHGHPFERSTTMHPRFVCDACRRPQALGRTVLSCRLCDYDLCQVCAELEQTASLSAALADMRAWLQGPGASAEREEFEARRAATEAAGERVLQALARPLTAYFERAYFEGQLYDGPRYRRTQDEQLQLQVLEHGGTGIRVWSEALDLRPRCEFGEPFVVLFWYTDASGLARVAQDGADHLAALATSRGSNGHFGTGIYVTGKEPQSFPSKEAVLFNNHWPRVGGSDAPLLRRATHTLEAGPQEPANRPVCDWILSDEQRRPLADYCVPLVVPEDFAFNIWERLPPDLTGWCPGCNRWGEKQWPERDIWIVQAGLSTADVKQSKVVVARRRMAHLQGMRGPQHPEALACVTELAWLLRGMGEYREAEPLFRQDLRASEEQLGPTHPDTLTSVDTLAGVLKAMGVFDEAETLYRRALEGSLRALGPAHPDTLTSLNNLAGLLKAVGKLEEAETLYRRALTGSQETLGRTHPDTLTSMQNLASLLQARNTLAEAEELFREVLSAREEALGAADPRTLRSSSSLAALLELTGCHSEAELLLRRTCSASQAHFGAGHPDAALYTCELADFLERTDRPEEALRVRSAPLESCGLLGAGLRSN